MAKKKERVKKFDKYLLLSWKKFGLIVLAWVAAFLLHGFVYGLGIYFFGDNFWGPGGDEAFFFILAVIVIPLYVIVSVVYSLVRVVMKKSK